jgi:hypothetical protein
MYECAQLCAVNICCTMSWHEHAQLFTLNFCVLILIFMFIILKSLTQSQIKVIHIHHLVLILCIKNQDKF